MLNNGNNIYKNILILFCLLGVEYTFAQNNDQLSYTTYYFNDSNDNSVVTTSFSLAKKIISGTAFLLDIELDKVTLPPVDGSTGASRPSRSQNETFEKNRGQVIIGLEQSLGETASFALNAYRSQELDYISNAIVGTISKEFFQRNTTVAVKGQYNDDQVGELTNSGEVINEGKTTVTAAFNFTQIVSKNAVLNLAYDYMQMDGYLSDPYRNVTIYNSNIQSLRKENHPDKRIRHALTSKISQFLETVRASVIGDYRYYFDDWDVQSHTAELRLNKYVFDNFIIGFNYRHYMQNGAEFYKERYEFTDTYEDEFYTADYKLQPFQSSTFGFNLKLLLKKWEKDNPGWEFLDKSSLNMMYLRYTNDLHFSANIIQATLSIAI